MKKINRINLNSFIVVLLALSVSSFGHESYEGNGDIIERAGYLSINSDSLIVERKYLISNNSVGFFNIGRSWQDMATNDYNYDFDEGYGWNCFDACCDGGFALKRTLEINQYGDVGNFENVEIGIGAPLYENAESCEEESRYASNPDVFFVCTDNCSGWYWKDKIEYLVVFSDRFKTKEGVGVGTTLWEVQEQFGELVIHVGLVTGESEPDPISFQVSSYSNITFILDINDWIEYNEFEACDFESPEYYELLENLETKETLAISDFKKGSKIQKILLNNYL